MHSIPSCDSQVLFKVHYVAGIVLNQMSNVVGTRNYFIIEGSLEVKLPTIWTDEKQSREEAEKRKIRREKIRRERVRRKKMQMREKVGKSRNTVFFQ